jgi:hypothetical protein
MEPQLPQEDLKSRRIKRRISQRATMLGLIYLGVISFLFTLLYGYLIAHNRNIPHFVPATIAFTLGPLVYTLKPNFVE